MAGFPYRVTRVTIAGTYSGGAEEWSTGFWMGYTNGDADLPNQQLADDVAAAWRTFFLAPTSYFGAAWHSSYVKISSIGTDGKASSADTVYSTFAADANGTASTQFPPQISLVATLTGSAARGVASKGRMYLPGISAAVGTGGRISSTNAGTIATNLQTFLNAVNASAATNNVLVLASHGSLNADGTPKVGGQAMSIKAVTGCRVGDVYDTQRRRRNGISEVYTSKTLV
jgi:hypothetical protein